MVPFYNSFRRMVKHYIPKMSSTDIDAYDHLITLPHHLREQLIMLTGDKLNSLKDADIERIKDAKLQDTLKKIKVDSVKMQKDLLGSYKEQLDLIQQVWAARRKLTLHRDMIFQLPLTKSKILRYFDITKQYLRLRAKIFRKLQIYRLRNQTSLYQIIWWLCITGYFGFLAYYIITDFIPKFRW